MVVAYIFPLARPWPGIENTVVLSPALISRVRRLSPLILHPLRTHNRAIGATRAQHGLNPYASPCIPSCIHTHTLSLSPSLSGSGITTTYTAPSFAHSCALYSGVQPGYYFHFSSLFELTRGVPLHYISGCPSEAVGFFKLAVSFPILLLQFFPCLGNPIHIISNRTPQGVLIRSTQPPLPEEYCPPTQSHHHGTQQHA